VIANRDGSSIYLKDVATIIDGIKETETISRYNANTAIGLLMYKQTDANAVEVSEQVQAEIKKLEQEYAAQGRKVCARAGFV
jgi:HAE1 family hydrophobic/amphiphilic exporter-1